MGKRQTVWVRAYDDSERFRGSFLWWLVELLGAIGFAIAGEAQLPHGPSNVQIALYAGVGVAMGLLSVYLAIYFWNLAWAAARQRNEAWSEIDDARDVGLELSTRPFALHSMAWVTVSNLGPTQEFRAQVEVEGASFRMPVKDAYRALWYGPRDQVPHANYTQLASKHLMQGEDAHVALVSVRRFANGGERIEFWHSEVMGPFYTADVADWRALRVKLTVLSERRKPYSRVYIFARTGAAKGEQIHVWDDTPENRTEQASIPLSTEEIIARLSDVTRQQMVVRGTDLLSGKAGAPWFDPVTSAQMTQFGLMKIRHVAQPANPPFGAAVNAIIELTPAGSRVIQRLMEIENEEE